MPGGNKIEVRFPGESITDKNRQGRSVDADVLEDLDKMWHAMFKGSWRGLANPRNCAATGGRHGWAMYTTLERFASGLTYYSCIHSFRTFDDIIDSRVPTAESGYGRE